MKRSYKCAIVLSALLIILFLSYRYNDLKYIVFYEFSFVDKMVNLPEMGFYEYCMQQYELYGFETGACMALWGMSIYAVLGVWGIPIYIVSKMTGLDIYQLILKMPVIAYGKFVIVVFLILTLILCLKIIKQENVGIASSVNRQKMVILFLSSYFVVAPIFIQGQCDIIEIFFMILGIYFLTARNNRALFLIMFMISVSMKQMSLLYFIPVLLFIEKKIWKIALNLIAVVALPLLNRSLFGGPLDISINLGNIEKILAHRLPFLNGDIPLFFILYLGICLACYLTQRKENDTKNTHIICLLGLIIYGSINIFSNQIYRCIYVAPFLLLALPMVKENIKHIVFWETILEICYAFYQICNYAWCFEITNCKYMLPEKIFGSLPPNSDNILVESFTTRFSSIWMDVIAGSAVIILLILIGLIVMGKFKPQTAFTYIESASLENVIFFRVILVGVTGLVPIALYAFNAIGP